MGWEDRDYHREAEYGREKRMGPFVLTRLTLILIGVCLGIHILRGITSWGMDFAALTFYRGGFRPWQLITYQYLHGGAGHVLMNCLGILFFFPALDLRWGWKKALAFYTLGGVVAGLTFGLMGLAFNLRANFLIGASGSVLACIGACALLFPSMQIILIFFPLPIRVAACLFAVFYLVSTLGDRNLSDACHLGGLAFGFCAPLAAPWLEKLKHKWAVKKEINWIDEDRRQQEVVDRILEKVHKQGMQSLSSGEKKALKKATEWQRQRDRGR
jgi:membrane associated rhomboid family serine protease